MTKIILVRHGYSVANKGNLFAGHTDVELSDIGYKQAELVSDYILANYKVDAVYTSDLQRASNTVKKVADSLNLPLQKTTAFREIFAGEWETLSFDEIAVKFPDKYAIWITNTGLARCPGGENMFELQERAFNKMLEIAKTHEGQTVVIGTHAGVIRALQCAVEKVTLESMKDITWVPNASISLLKFENGEFTPEFWGYNDYLEELKTKIPTRI